MIHRNMTTLSHNPFIYSSCFRSRSRPRSCFRSFHFSSNSISYSPFYPVSLSVSFHTITRNSLLTDYFLLNLKRNSVWLKPYSSYTPLHRNASNCSYDLQFDHKTPILSLKEMIINGKLQYDYTVYWKKSDETVDTVGKPLTRRLKKEKMLKELIDKYTRLFDSVLKSPKDYKLYIYFCEARLKLDKYLILQMGQNYLYRFLHSEKVFQKHERDLFCLDILNVEKFDIDLERLKIMREDISEFSDKIVKVLKCIITDLTEYSSLIGDKVVYKDITKIALQILNASYISKLEVSRDFVDKILPRLKKERAKRKSAEDLTNDSLFCSDTPTTDLPKNKKTESPVPLPSASTEGSSPTLKRSHNFHADNLLPPFLLLPSTQSNIVSLPESADSSSSSSEEVEGRRPKEEARSPALLSISAINLTQPLLSNPSDPSRPSNPHLPSPSRLHKFFKSPLDVPNIQVFLRVLPLLLVSLFTIGIRILSFNANSSDSGFLYHYQKGLSLSLLWSNSLIILSLVAALVVTFALNSRNMPKPMEIVKLFIQVLITFLLIVVLCEFLTHDIISEMDPTDNPTDNIAPPVDPTDKIDSYKPTTTTPWYKNIKVWCCVLFAGLAAAGIYYFKGFAPISPDDMASFNETVSQGIENVASSQASLHQTLSERVNSAAFQVEILNRSSEEMLSDIAAAGDAARLQLEQMTGVTQDLSLLHGRVSNLDDRMTAILKGVMYLISLRWLFLHPDHSCVSGSEVVNEVLSLERPLSFSEVVEPTATVSTQTLSEVVEPTATVSTQTDDMDFGRIYELIIPSVIAYGAARVVWRLRSILPVVGDSMESVESFETSMESLTPSSPDYTTPHRLERHSLLSTNHSSEELSTNLDLSTSEITPLSVTPQSTPQQQSSGILSQSSEITTPRSSSDSDSDSEEITPQSTDHILLCDNPTFQSSTPTSTSSSPDDTNPYQVHRHNFFRVGRHIPFFLQLLEILGI